MEGDMKEIVLERLEQRLKEKDEEIHGLKKELQGSSDRPGHAEEFKSLTDRVDHMEMEAREAQITMSELMKKVGALESALNSMLMSLAENEESYPGEDLSVPGSMPMDPQPFDKFAAEANRKDINEDGHRDSDALRFFQLNKNS